MSWNCRHDDGSGWCSKYLVWCCAYVRDVRMCKGFEDSVPALSPEQTTLSDLLPQSSVNTPLGGCGASLGGNTRDCGERAAGGDTCRSADAEQGEAGASPLLAVIEQSAL